MLEDIVTMNSIILIVVIVYGTICIPGRFFLDMYYQKKWIESGMRLEYEPALRTSFSGYLLYGTIFIFVIGYFYIKIARIL